MRPSIPNTLALKGSIKYQVDERACRYEFNFHVIQSGLIFFQSREYRQGGGKGKPLQGEKKLKYVYVSYYFSCATHQPHPLPHNSVLFLLFCELSRFSFFGLFVSPLTNNPDVSPHSGLFAPTSSAPHPYHASSPFPRPTFFSSL